jgi:hypothetical protein
VSHHGSLNGTPRHQLDKVLPEDAPDSKPRFAVVSTHDGAYSGVPDAETLALVGSRAHLDDTRSVGEGGWFDITFPEGPGELPESRRGP